MALLLVLLFAAPADAAVVAREGGYEMRARYGDDGLCLTLTVRGRETGGGGCERGPVSHFRPLQAEPFYPPEHLLGLAVPPDVAEVAIGTPARTGPRVPTSAAPGFRARFLLTERRGSLLRLRDAGRLVGAAERDRLDTPRLVSESGGVRFRTDFTLRPTPRELDRTVDVTCVRFGQRSTSVERCITPASPPRLAIDVVRRCNGIGLATGIARPGVRAVRLVLGSGRIVDARLRAAPARYGDFTLVTANLPPRTAVRSAEAIGAGGRVVKRVLLRSPPDRDDCNSSVSYTLGDSFEAFLFGLRIGRPRRPAVTVGRAGAGALRVADGERRGQICVGFVELRCVPAPVDPQVVPLQAAPGAVGGAVPQSVASATLVLDDRRRVPAEVTPGDAYTGRFAGGLRFLAAPVPKGRTLRRAILRDADGRPIGNGVVFTVPSVAVVQRFAPDLVLLRVGPFPPFLNKPSYCATPPARSPFRSVCAERAAAEATVSCAPRRMLIYGLLPRGTRRAEAVLDDGRAVRARVERLPGGDRLWSVRPPRTAGTRAVRFDNGDRRTIVLPPAAKQCGYGTSGF